MQVTSTDAKKERELIREMAQIKESKSYLEEIEVLREIINRKKNEKYETGKDLGKFKTELDTLRKRISEIKKTQENIQETRETIQKALDKINQERNAIRV